MSLLGDNSGGGIEIIGYDAKERNYAIQFFDSQGNATRHHLTSEGRTWTWHGKHTRCTGVLSKDGRMMTCRYERADDGVNWVRSMDATLRKVE